MHAKQSVARPGNAPPYPPSRNNSRLMDPESHPETTSQERPSYATIDRKPPFDDPPIDAAGTAPAGASSQQLRTRDPHFEDHRTPTVPMPASSSRQTTANRKDFGGPEVGLDIWPRGSQPPVGAGNSQSVAVQPTSISNPSDISTSKEAPSRVGWHEAVGASSSPILSTTRPSPATIPPPSQNVPSTRISQETRGDISFGLPRMEAPRKSDRFPPPQTDSHRDRNENRSRALQADRPPSVQSSAQSFNYPPPSLNRPNLPTTPSLSPPALALTTTASSRVQAPVRYGAAPPELPRPYDERSAKGYAEETPYANLSAASHKLQSPPVPTVPPVGHPSCPQPASEPRRFVKDDSRIQGIEGIDREAQRATDELTSDEGRRWGAVSERDTPSNQGPIVPDTPPIQSSPGTCFPQGSSAPLLSHPRPSNGLASRASREAQPERKAGPVVIAPSAFQRFQLRKGKSFRLSRYQPERQPAPSQRLTSLGLAPEPPKPLSEPSRTPQAADNSVILPPPRPPGALRRRRTRLEELEPRALALDEPPKPQLAPNGTLRSPPEQLCSLIRPRATLSRAWLEELEPLAFGPPKVPFSGRPRPQAPPEIVPAPRLVAVPSIAERPTPPGVVPESTPERFSYIPSKKFSSSGAHSHRDYLDDENDGSGQGGPVGSIPHWKEGRHQEVEAQKGVEVHEMVAGMPEMAAGVHAMAAEVPEMATEVHEIGAQEHKTGAEVRENGVLLHTKGTAHADATCWSHFRSLFGRNSRKSSPN